jgi:hypothetical protein
MPTAEAPREGFFRIGMTGGPNILSGPLPANGKTPKLVEGRSDETRFLF